MECDWKKLLPAKQHCSDFSDCSCDRGCLCLHRTEKKKKLLQNSECNYFISKTFPSVLAFVKSHCAEAAGVVNIGEERANTSAATNQMQVEEILDNIAWENKGIKDFMCVSAILFLLTTTCHVSIAAAQRSVSERRTSSHHCTNRATPHWCQKHSSLCVAPFVCVCVLPQK